LIESAGTLLYRRNGGQLEVLIVHPWGPYNRRAPWSIPKGRTNPGEDLEAAARRETFEETGVQPGPLHSIGSVDLARSRKRIHGFAGPAPQGAAPRSDQRETDEAKFVAIERARFLLHPAQVTFLDRLLATIDLGKAVPPPPDPPRDIGST
jgi:predicted NUDIX family NTP pyrophosphohydrolase